MAGIWLGRILGHWRTRRARAGIVCFQEGGFSCSGGQMLLGAGTHLEDVASYLRDYEID
jgi:hypothetical protein